MGLIPKTTQNYKTQKYPWNSETKPTHNRGFFQVIPLGTHFPWVPKFWVLALVHTYLILVSMYHNKVLT